MCRCANMSTSTANRNTIIVVFYRLCYDNIVWTFVVAAERGEWSGHHMFQTLRIFVHLTLSRAVSGVCPWQFLRQSRNKTVQVSIQPYESGAPQSAIKKLHSVKEIDNSYSVRNDPVRGIDFVILIRPLRRVDISFEVTRQPAASVIVQRQTAAEFTMSRGDTSTRSISDCSASDSGWVHDVSRWHVNL